MVKNYLRSIWQKEKFGIVGFSLILFSGAITKITSEVPDKYESLNIISSVVGTGVGAISGMCFAGLCGGLIVKHSGDLTKTNNKMNSVMMAGCIAGGLLGHVVMDSFVEPYFEEANQKISVLKQEEKQIFNKKSNVPKVKFG